MRSVRLSVLILLITQPIPLNAQPKSLSPATPRKPVASPDDLVRMAGTLLGMKRFDEAITASTLALEEEPENPDALFNRAIAYAWTNRLEEATRDLDAAEKIAPGTAVAHRVRAILADRRSDLDTELAELSKSLLLEPNNPFALDFRSSIYIQRRQYEAALADAEAYVRAEPQEVDGYERKARILKAQQKWPLALEQADLIAARFGSDPRALASAAGIYGDSGNRHKALALLERAIALDEGSYYLWTTRAGLRRWDDYAGRRLDLQAAIRLAPDDVSIIALLGLLEFDTKNWKAADARFSAALDKYPKDFGVLAYRSMSRYKMGDLGGARKDYDAAIAVASGGDDFSSVCGFLAARGVALDWALAACDRAVSIDPEKPDYRIERGLTKLRQGDLDGAIADYDRAIAINPDRAFAHYGRALAYLRKGNRDVAATARGHALAIEPTIDETFAAYGLDDFVAGPASVRSAQPKK